MFPGVCLSTGGSGQGGCLVQGGACSRRECLVLGSACSGWSGPGGLVWGVPGGDPPMATAVGGTHPTGMHYFMLD